jgi:hypothetical protein
MTFWSGRRMTSNSRCEAARSSMSLKVWCPKWNT